MAGIRSHDDPETGYRSAEMLRKIAETVDIPVEEFTQTSDPRSEKFQNREMLRLWSRLGNSADREKLLVFARALAEGLADR